MSMSDAAYVEEATTWAKRLVHRASRGPGDYDNAMRRVAREIGVPYAKLWALHYRKPKGVFAGIYHRLKDAYESAYGHQLRALQNDAEKTAAIAGHDAPAVVAAMALVDEALRSQQEEKGDP